MAINETASGESAIAVGGTATGPHTVGVRGIGDGAGLVGISTAGWGANGESQSGVGVRGVSTTGWGVNGEGASGVGVRGVSKTGWGVDGESESGVGVRGVSQSNAGVNGESSSGDGVRGISANANGVSAFGGHTGVYAKGPVNAGYFDGNVHVSGNITSAGDVILTNADCAEDFDVSEVQAIEPGTVVVLGEEGAVHQSTAAYDKRVAGVISGAGGYKPGIVLDKHAERTGRKPVALLGKVFCKVDAGFGAVTVGDLLTTSDTPGHAMKASDPRRAFGCVLGKALRPLREGVGLIPILVALQ